jgi:hypothetical protein
MGPANQDKLGDSLEPLEGAITTLFCATSPEVYEQKNKYSGAYLLPFGVVSEPSEDAQDMVLAEELWDTTNKVLQDLI